MGRNKNAVLVILVAVLLVVSTLPVVGSGIAPAAYNTIQQALSSLTKRPILNFAAQMNCVDDSGNNSTDCTPVAYGTIQNSGTPLTQRATVNFTGAGVSCADSGGITVCTISGGGGGGSGGGGVLGYSQIVPLTGLTTSFIPAVGGALPNATETSVQTLLETAGTINNLGISLSAALGTGNSGVFTYRDNASSQTLTCTISGASATTCSDVTHSFSVSVGDKVDVQAVFSGTITSTLTFTINASYSISPSTNASDTQWLANNSGVIQGVVGTSVIPQSGWTVVNAGSMAVYNDFGSGFQDLYSNQTGSLNWRLLQRSLPGATYTIYATIQCFQQAPSSSASVCGLYISDGTKLAGIEVGCTTTVPFQVRVEHMTNVTTDSTTVAGPTSNAVGALVTLRIQNNGSNRTYSYWTGGAWTVFFTEATGTFLTETTGGPGLGIINAGFVDMGLRYWKQTTP